MGSKRLTLLDFQDKPIDIEQMAMAKRQIIHKLQNVKH